MKLVIKPYRPAVRIMIFAAMVVVITIVVGMALDVGYWQFISGAISDHGALLKENQRLKADDEKARATIGRLERSLQIEEQSRRDLQQSIAKIRTDTAELEQEVEFYRSIISSVEDGAGPRVEGFKIYRFDDKGGYLYRIVLTHVSRDNRFVEGSVDVRFDGTLDGQFKGYELSELGEPDDTDLHYKFKHFRRIEGIVRMPDGFDVERVHVALRAQDNAREIYQATYRWAEFFN